MDKIYLQDNRVAIILKFNGLLMPIQFINLSKNYFMEPFNTKYLPEDLEKLGVAGNRQSAVAIASNFPLCENYTGKGDITGSKYKCIMQVMLCSDS